MAAQPVPVDYDPFAAAPTPPWKANPSGYLQQHVGVPVRITSAGRSAAHNAAVGGVPRSVAGPR